MDFCRTRTCDLQLSTPMLYNKPAFKARSKVYPYKNTFLDLKQAYQDRMLNYIFYSGMLSFPGLPLTPV